MRILVAGDFCQRYRVDTAIRNHQFGELFDEIKPIVASADYSIVNFEFPIVPQGKVPTPIPKCGPNFQGTVDSVLAIEYAGFKCCTLANNHILDQGEEYCIETKKEIEKRGIDTVGVGANLSDAGSILYKTIGKERLAIINCCEHEFSIAMNNSAGANPLNPVRQFYEIKEARENADYVLVVVHGGHEHFQLPSTRMQETYRFFIDAGADAVVNGHQHCYSGFEEFKDKVIVYGLGNFCFDNPKGPNGWNEGYMVMLEFDGGNARINQLYPFVQCDESIGVHPINDVEFKQKISVLNDTINSFQNLQKKESEYYSKSAKHILGLYQPYENRFLKKLYNMRLLPSAVSKKRLLSIWNFIECESHRDKQLFSFREKFKY